MRLKVLVIGAGMYVCGRQTDGYGTVLPALMEGHRNGLVEKVSVAATQAKSIQALMKKSRKLKSLMAISLPLSGFPKKGRDPLAYKKILEKQPFDCAIVAVPDHLHFKITSDLINLGIHTLVVKPLVPTLKEARCLVALAAKNKIYGAVEFHKRFDEANRKMKEVIASGKIGDVSYVSVAYSQKKIIPLKVFRSWAPKTNIFQYLGVHYIDLIHFATEAYPVRVTATGQKNWLKKKGINTYDAIQALIEWKAKRTGKTFVSSILTNWIDPNATSAMSDQKINVIGTFGRYESDQKNRGVQIVTDKEGIEDFNPYFSQFYVDLDGKKVLQGYGEKSIRQFLTDVQSLKTGQRTVSSLKGSRPSFLQACVSTAVIEAVNKSLKKDSVWVKIGKL